MDKGYLGPGIQVEEGRETYLLHLLAAVATHRDRELDRLFEPLDLSVQKYRVMLAIARFPDCTMKELAQFTFIDRTTLTRMIDQLVAKGRVTRQHSTRDRRQVILGITPEGFEIGLKAVELLRQANHAAVGQVSPQDLSPAIRALESVLAALLPDPEKYERVRTMRRPDAG